MKKPVFCLVFGFLAAACFSQKAILIVPPFENRGSNLDAASLENMQDYLINAFINDGRFQVPDRNALSLMTKEHEFQLSDWSDDNKSASMGKMLNADYIVRVIVMYDGVANILTARILDVNTAGGLSAGEMEFTNQRDARFKMDDFVVDILKRIGRGAVSTSRTANISIEISTKAGGILYFQGSETATLWDNDTYTIPIDQPGTYSVKMVFGNGGVAERSVVIASRGVTRVDFTYYVGAVGPAGGVIFYDKGNTIGGWQFLEAAPASTEFVAPWGAYLKTINNTETAIGTGKRNTDLIVFFLRRIGESGKAAQLCDDLVYGGYSDWFLPSRDELDAMYKNLKLKGWDNFGSGWYWSSSETDRGYAIEQQFSDGKQGIYLKDFSSSVRAIRAF
ncbi:MAG: DUF1566 domain-containing protein [Treponema sp.]|jgi:hypothetical protein|nr:DUF1566 domain-containing protein [Treponema sp.]